MGQHNKSEERKEGVNPQINESLDSINKVLYGWNRDLLHRMQSSYRPRLGEPNTLKSPPQLLFHVVIRKEREKSACVH